MPCTCTSDLAKGVFVGATVLSGDPILMLFSDQSEPLAQARLSQRGLTRYLAGDQAEVVFVTGAVIPVTLAIDTSKAQPTATILWPEGTRVPADGTIARLRFNKLNGRLARSVKSRLTGYASLITQRN